MRKTISISTDEIKIAEKGNPLTEAVKYGQNRITDLVNRANQYALNSKSKNTKRSYESDWRSFTRFCDENGLEPLPASPQTVCLYLSDLASRCKYSTVKRRLATIVHYHEINGHPSPKTHRAVMEVMAGIRRANGNEQVGRKPILKDDLRRMIEALPKSLSGVRDKAVLLCGFFSACRRSELVGLDVEDVQFFANQGIVFRFRGSKTDKAVEGQEVGIPLASNPALCPVRALREWLIASEITLGPLFRAVDRHGNVLDRRLAGCAVAMIVKRAAEAAGIDASNLSAHSLRSGFWVLPV